VPALTHDLLSALLPGRCPGCGARAEPVCPRCAATIRPAPALAPPVGVDTWVAAFEYSGVARELVARVKYRNHRGALPYLARAVAGAVEASGAPFDVVTWAPTTDARRRARGFDHAALLAGGVAAALGRPVRALLLRDPGPAQTGRPSRERRGGPALRARRAVTGARVLVVDDVATTGATLASAAAALRSAGAVAVVGATAARTPPPGSV
jgi:predicted amidophosphoribosyltransferase